VSRDLESSHDALRAALVARRTLAYGHHLLKLTWKQDGRDCRMDREFRIGH
jgi:hypothetical protein